LNKVFGISLAVLAIALATVPFFTDCASHGEYMKGAMGMLMPMRCYGNRVAEVAVGVPLFAAGAVMTFAKFKSRAALFSLSVIAVLAGVAGVLMPTAVVGTCRDPMSICNTAMKPALLVIGSLVIVGGSGSVLSVRRFKL